MAGRQLSFGGRANIRAGRIAWGLLSDPSLEQDPGLEPKSSLELNQESLLDKILR
jgi:hypothetical protein